jgi:hypothetical protein|tara:strand:+ start:110 stop:247 length:138 start_codon:yes stop_codon:yes gene_type:complete
MGTFTLASGLGLLFCGITVMIVGGAIGLYIINNHLPKDKEGENDR